jgi:hypothetical protein
MTFIHLKVDLQEAAFKFTAAAIPHGQHYYTLG